MAKILTTKGHMDEALLEKKVVKEDRERVVSEATEYRHGGELVRRDVHIRAYTMEELEAKAKTKGPSLS